jgi:hypothetical protein
MCYAVTYVQMHVCMCVCMNAGGSMRVLRHETPYDDDRGGGDDDDGYGGGTAYMPRSLT